MKKDGCPYCQKGEFLEKFGVLAFETETSEVIVFKEQKHKGRAIVAYKKDHVAEITDLTDQERNAFMKDGSRKRENPDSFPFTRALLSNTTKAMKWADFSILKRTAISIPVSQIRRQTRLQKKYASLKADMPQCSHRRVRRQISLRFLTSAKRETIFSPPPRYTEEHTIFSA